MEMNFHGLWTDPWCTILESPSIIVKTIFTSNNGTHWESCSSWHPHSLFVSQSFPCKITNSQLPFCLLLDIISIWPNALFYPPPPQFFFSLYFQVVLQQSKAVCNGICSNTGWMYLTLLPLERQPFNLPSRFWTLSTRGSKKPNPRGVLPLWQSQIWHWPWTYITPH